MLESQQTWSILIYNLTHNFFINFLHIKQWAWEKEINFEDGRFWDYLAQIKIDGGTPADMF